MTLRYHSRVTCDIIDLKWHETIARLAKRIVINYWNNYFFLSDIILNFKIVIDLENIWNFEENRKDDYKRII